MFSRTELLYGEKAIKYFATCRVAVFEIGGVGGHLCVLVCPTGSAKPGTKRIKK